MIAWRAPDPPLPEFGIELNFGMDTREWRCPAETPVGDVSDQETEQTQEQDCRDTPEEVKTEVKEEVKEVPENASEKVVSKEPGDVAVKEEKKEVKMKQR